ncbi:hypothetical protein SALBM311S_01744 [Streptomyces alboniger]
MSFIPLGLVLPALARCVKPDSDLVMMVKPQEFEVGKEQAADGGVVRSPQLRADAVRAVAGRAWRTSGAGGGGGAARPRAEALSSAATATAALGSPRRIPEAMDDDDLAAATQRALDAVRSHDPSLAALADRIGEIGILLGDVAGELAGYADDLDADPLRLAAVEERRAALTALTRKYGEDIAWCWRGPSACHAAHRTGRRRRAHRGADRRAGRPAATGRSGAGVDRRADGRSGAVRGRRDRRAGLAGHAARARVLRHPADRGPGGRRGRRTCGRLRAGRCRRGRTAAGPASGGAAPAHRQGCVRG